MLSLVCVPRNKIERERERAREREWRNEWQWEEGMENSVMEAFVWQKSYKLQKNGTGAFLFLQSNLVSAHPLPWAEVNASTIPCLLLLPQPTATLLTETDSMQGVEGLGGNTRSLAALVPIYSRQSMGWQHVMSGTRESGNVYFPPFFYWLGEGGGSQAKMAATEIHSYQSSTCFFQAKRKLVYYIVSSFWIP